MKVWHDPNCNSRYPASIHGDPGDMTCDCGLDAMLKVVEAAREMPERFRSHALNEALAQYDGLGKGKE